MSTDRAPRRPPRPGSSSPRCAPSGPASEQAGYTEGHAAGYAAGVRAAAKEQRRWRDRMAAEQAASLAAGQQDLDRAVPRPRRGADRLRAPQRAGPAGRRGSPGPHGAGTGRGHPGLRTGRRHPDRPRRPGPRPVRERRRHGAGDPAATRRTSMSSPGKARTCPPACRCSRTPPSAAATPRSEYQQGWLDASLGSALDACPRGAPGRRPSRDPPRGQA